MKLTPFAKLFITFVILGVLAYTGYHYGGVDKIRAWSSADKGDKADKKGDKVGGAIKVTGFVRYALGEGIERQETDFAAEVAAAAGQS